MKVGDSGVASQPAWAVDARAAWLYGHFSSALDRLDSLRIWHNELLCGGFQAT
jgi:hypothetical protein